METQLRVRDLRTSLGEIRILFKAAGARPQEKAFAAICDAVEEFDDEPVETYFARLQDAAAEAAAPPEQRFARKLEAAGLDEKAFRQAIAELEGSKLKKPALLKIAKAYCNFSDRRASASKIIDEINKSFYTKLYEDQSREIAKRSSPI